MDTKRAFAMPEDYCPVMEDTCPNGTESAQACQKRFLGDFNPLHNYRDYSILCCAAHRRAGMAERDELPPLV